MKNTAKDWKPFKSDFLPPVGQEILLAWNKKKIVRLGEVREKREGDFTLSVAYGGLWIESSGRDAPDQWKPIVTPWEKEDS